jgi:hypothetical protein
MIVLRPTKNMNKSVPKLPENQVYACSNPPSKLDIFAAKEELCAKED